MDEIRRYEIDPITGCWNWLGSIRKDGYGRWCFHCKVQLAHRVMFFLTRGKWPRLKLDHTCRNRKCVNPDHLEDTTSAVNNQRGLRAKLTPRQVGYIRSAYRSIRGQRVSLMRQFGISSTQFRRIVKGESWSNLA